MREIGSARSTLPPSFDPIRPTPNTLPAPSDAPLRQPSQDEVDQNTRTLTSWISSANYMLETATATCNVDKSYLEGGLEQSSRAAGGLAGVPALKDCYAVCTILLRAASQTCDAENGPPDERERATSSAAASVAAAGYPFPQCACSPYISKLRARVDEDTQWLSGHRAELEEAIREHTARVEEDAREEQAARLDENAKEQKVKELLTWAYELQRSWKSPEDLAREEATFRAQVQPYLSYSLELQLAYGEAITDPVAQTKAFESVLADGLADHSQSLATREDVARAYADLNRFDMGLEALESWRKEHSGSLENETKVRQSIDGYKAYVESIPVRQRVKAAGGLSAATAEERAALARDTRAAAAAKKKPIDDPELLAYRALDHGQRSAKVRDDYHELATLQGSFASKSCSNGEIEKCWLDVLVSVGIRTTHDPKTQMLVFDVAKLDCADGTLDGCLALGSAAAEQSSWPLAFGYSVAACELNGLGCSLSVDIIERRFWKNGKPSKPDYGWWDRANALADTYHLATRRYYHVG
ncbi:MAG TPA: hypothetical protein VE907_11525 [Gammaproteobacteria bacterium]|nr:hypothetical protein [Gammaproteobacteria bacterium]